MIATGDDGGDELGGRGAFMRECGLTDADMPSIGWMRAEISAAGMTCNRSPSRAISELRNLTEAVASGDMRMEADAIARIMDVGVDIGGRDVWDALAAALDGSLHNGGAGAGAGATGGGGSESDRTLHMWSEGGAPRIHVLRRDPNGLAIVGSDGIVVCLVDWNGIMHMVQSDVPNAEYCVRDEVPCVFAQGISYEEGSYRAGGIRELHARPINRNPEGPVYERILHMLDA